MRISDWSSDVCSSDLTLSGIAHQYNVSLNELRHANGIKGSELRIGQTLRVPAHYRLHRVSSGQTLSGIAQRYNTSISALRSANGIRGSVLHAGQTLKEIGRASGRERGGQYG